MADPEVAQPAEARPATDPDSARWLQALSASGRERDDAVARLRELLLRASRTELHRRSSRISVTGPEFDDLADQAANDATIAVLGKLSEFRGESRFTTWVYKFEIFEVSGKLGRHFWRTPAASLDGDQWERLPDRLGTAPAEMAQARSLLEAVRRAVDEELTERQRAVFVAIVVNGVPLDALVAQLGTNRNAVYKTVFDARRKIRQYLVTNGYVDTAAEGEQP